MEGPRGTALERFRRGGQIRGHAAAQVFRQLRLDDPASHEIAAEPEENGLRPGRGPLRAPLRFHAEEARDEPANRPRRVYQEPGAGERIAGSRV